MDAVLHGFEEFEVIVSPPYRVPVDVRLAYPQRGGIYEPVGYPVSVRVGRGHDQMAQCPLLPRGIGEGDPRMAENDLGDHGKALEVMPHRGGRFFAHIGLPVEHIVRRVVEVSIHIQGGRMPDDNMCLRSEKEGASPILLRWKHRPDTVAQGSEQGDLRDPCGALGDPHRRDHQLVRRLVPDDPEGPVFGMDLSLRH